MSLKVYVAAPYAQADRVRSIHAQLRAAGYEPVSRWAEQANGVEVLTPETAQEAIPQNDADVERCDVLLAILVPGQGGEMFAEMRRAVDLEKRVIACVGERSVLSAYRQGVVRVTRIDAAFEELQRFAKFLQSSCKAIR